jgi:hypothetical protein
MSETSNQFVDPLLPESLGVVAYGTGVGVLIAQRGDGDNPRLLGMIGSALGASPRTGGPGSIRSAHRAAEAASRPVG